MKTNNPTIFQRYIMPSILVFLCPPFVMILWYTNVYLNASFLELATFILNKGLVTLLQESWFVRFFGTPTSWAIILIFMALQLLLMKVLPGKIYYGTRTPNNNIPEYKNNGVCSYVVSFALFISGGLIFNWYKLSIVYTHFGDILASLNIFALVFCVFLYLKGRFAPSTSDHGLSGSPIFDFYWGTELYPRVFGWDIKMFTNCRFGMTGWAIAVLSFAFANYEITNTINYGIFVSALLIDVYLLKFFIWEAGYMRSMDIQVDRAGFYICWGCLVWVPSLYTLPVFYMVEHSPNLSIISASILFIAGIIAIFTNYWADLQRQKVRETNGNCKVFGKPPKIIKAEYTTEDGKMHTNELLASGFWGISRHFHYIPELTAAFLWSTASGFNQFMPFLYFVFLTILLVHRSIRDEKKCSLKYGKYWEEYRAQVPYKLIPFLY